VAEEHTRGREGGSGTTLLEGQGRGGEREIRVEEEVVRSSMEEEVVLTMDWHVVSVLTLCCSMD
jgi:hypothetical protein